MPQTLILPLHHWRAGPPVDLDLSLWCLLTHAGPVPHSVGCSLDGQFCAVLPHWIAPDHRGLLSAGQRAGVWAQQVEMRRRQKGVWASSDFIVSGRSDGHGPPAGLCLSQGQRWPGWWAWRTQSGSEPEAEPEPPSGFPRLFSHNTGAWTIHSGQGLLLQAEKCAFPNTAGATIPGCVRTGEVARPTVR